MKKKCLNPSCGRVFEPGHYGRKQAICGDLPCKKWAKKYYNQTRKRPRGISGEETDKIRKALAKKPSLQSYIVVAAYSGMRKGEQLGMTWGDVLNGGEIKTNFILRGQWSDSEGFKPTKTKNARSVTLPRESRDALKAFRDSLKEKPRTTDRIWPFSESFVWRWFTRLQRRLGISNPDTGDPFRVHDLRHTAALRVYRLTNGDLNAARILLGQKSLETTRIYAEERPDEFAKRIDAALDGGPQGENRLSSHVEDNR